ncbi:MAG: DNA primase [Draconibacterium sp.]|nr:MAG: DNA primase [Draconibacterium sp.]
MEPKETKGPKGSKGTAQPGTDKPDKPVDSKMEETKDLQTVSDKPEKPGDTVDLEKKSEKEVVDNIESEPVDQQVTEDEAVSPEAESREKIAETAEADEKLGDNKSPEIEDTEKSPSVEETNEGGNIAEKDAAKAEDKSSEVESAETETETEAPVSEEKLKEESEPAEKDDSEIEKDKLADDEAAPKVDGSSETEKDKEKPADQNQETTRKEAVDYSRYSEVDLVNAFRDLLDQPEEHHDLKGEVDSIKSAFYKKRNENIEKERKAFLKDGGEEADFQVSEDPYENDIRELLRRFRQLRKELNKQLELEKEENLQKKYEVIEKIKGLINNEESINKTFNEFRELQQEWREIGLVPQSKMKNLWDTYHFHVENFYDYIKINRELRDLDLKKNLEAKIVLCENAEELLVEPSPVRAFNTLQKYHEQWREIGPVPRENKDDIWERFRTATGKINKKYQEFFETRKVEQKKNLEAKTALCEKAEEINKMEISGYKEWDQKSKEMIKLQKVWRTIGFAPKKDNNKIYERFRVACDSFFDNKREFYAANKELQQNNLQLKIDLCVQAEALKDSEDWNKTTQDFIYIQKQWKEIGPVPRKQSDAVWKRFRAACDHFFDKKSEHFSDVDSEQIENLKLKEALVEDVKNFKTQGDVDEDLKHLKEFHRRWTEIGHVPFKKKDDVQNRFREAIDKLYDDLKIDEDKRNLLRFKSKMASFSESNRGQNKMRAEREKYMNKLKQLENDLILLENNVGFFAKSKNAESLIADVKGKIENTRQKIETLKEKIRVIDSL